ncbi:MAG: YggS family pyridoxal phosphate-dependent enzyme [Saccharofermentanales bacterium]
MTDPRRQDIQARLDEVRGTMEAACERAGRTIDDVRLVAVSKTFPMSDVLEAIACGQYDFGENRVQELTPKMDATEAESIDCAWHLIGTLQRNKVKFVVGRVTLIHSVDSLRLLKAIHRHAKNLGIVQDVLLQVNVSGEATKHGFSPDDLDQVFQARDQFPNVRITGLMTMAPFTDDPETARPVFRALRELRDRWAPYEPDGALRELSMGMSQDYGVAIEEGATLIRVGSAIFGHRYTP